jgi:hypothetical protein
LSEGESRASETSGTAAATENFGVEVRRNRHGFIVWLPRTQSGYDSIWVIVDRLTKVAYFIPVKTTYSSAKLGEFYMARIVSLHGVPKKNVFERGP